MQTCEDNHLSTFDSQQLISDPGSIYTSEEEMPSAHLLGVEGDPAKLHHYRHSY